MDCRQCLHAHAFHSGNQDFILAEAKDKATSWFVSVGLCASSLSGKFMRSLIGDVRLETLPRRVRKSSALRPDMLPSSASGI